MNVLKSLKENITEIYVGALLFVGLPIVGWLYFDWRLAVAVTIVMQTVIGVLYIYRGGK